MGALVSCSCIPVFLYSCIPGGDIHWYNCFGKLTISTRVNHTHLPQDPSIQSQEYTDGGSLREQTLAKLLGALSSTRPQPWPIKTTGSQHKYSAHPHLPALEDSTTNIVSSSSRLHPEDDPRPPL